AHLLRASGESGGYYDKQRLVLFAESGPLAAPPPEATSESPRAFTAGTLPGILPSFVPLGVSICHEILYPELITRAVHPGAAALLAAALSSARAHAAPVADAPPPLVEDDVATPKSYAA